MKFATQCKSAAAGSVDLISGLVVPGVPTIKRSIHQPEHPLTDAV
jgi:hypothetical protein